MKCCFINLVPSTSSSHLLYLLLLGSSRDGKKSKYSGNKCFNLLPAECCLYILMNKIILKSDYFSFWQTSSSAAIPIYEDPMTLKVFKPDKTFKVKNVFDFMSHCPAPSYFYILLIWFSLKFMSAILCIPDSFLQEDKQSFYLVFYFP